MQALAANAVVVGLFAAVYCSLGLSGAALPNPDPTPKLLAAQAEEIRWWRYGPLGSLGVVAAGAVAFWRARQSRDPKS